MAWACIDCWISHVFKSYYTKISGFPTVENTIWIFCIFRRIFGKQCNSCERNYLTLLIKYKGCQVHVESWKHQYYVSIIFVRQSHIGEISFALMISGLWAILLYLENICNLFSGIGNWAMAFLTELVWTSVGDYILPLWATLFALPKAFARLGQLRRFPQIYINHSFQNAGFTPVPSSLKPLNLQWSALVAVL